MDYINKEYGFSFRPPFFNNFSEIRHTGPKLTRKNFLTENIIGAGLDYNALNGVLLASTYGAIWGIKIEYLIGGFKGKWLDQDDLIKNMNLNCAYSSSGNFAQFTHGALTVTWVKHNESTLIFRVSSKKKLRVRIIFYASYDWKAEFSVEDKYVKGRAPYVAIIPGDIHFNDENVVYKNRFKVTNENGVEKNFFMAKYFSTPLHYKSNYNESILEYCLNKNQPEIFFNAIIGDESIFTNDTLSLEKIKNFIENSELRYSVSKIKGEGALTENVIKLFNGTLWSRIYFPYLLKTIYTPNRNSLNNNFVLNGFDENCAALLGAVVRGYPEGFSQLKFNLEDKVFAPIAIWNIFCITQNKNKFFKIYNKLCDLYVPNAEFVKTSINDKNEVAYKWHDSPLKERNHKGAMISLDMSCMKVLTFEVLEKLSIFFEKNDVAEKYRLAKEKLKKLINDNLWDNKRCIYVDKYITGSFSYHIGATIFYPLVCGIVEDEDRIAKLIEKMMTDFWGDYCIPTLGEKNSEFGEYGSPNNNGIRKKPFLDYRGSIVPYVNYLIYQGLVRYGFDELAGLIALKSVKLWGNKNNNKNKRFFYPNGKAPSNRDYLCTNANMLLLLGLMELIDVEYNRNDLQTALRFGTFIPGEHMVENFILLENNYSLKINDNETFLYINKKLVFKALGGKFKVRNFIYSNNYCSFDIDTRAILKVEIFFHNEMDRQENKYNMNIILGKKHVQIIDSNIKIIDIQ